jgi:hypothetical protein
MSIGQVSKNKKAMKALEKKEGFFASAKNWLLKKAPELYNWLKPTLANTISAFTGIPSPLINTGINTVENIVKTGYKKYKEKNNPQRVKKSRTIVEELPDDYDGDDDVEDSFQIEKVGGNGATNRSDYDILKYKK